MKQRLSYISQGRSGYVVYQDDQGDIRLYYEFGGGNCIAIINVPTPTEWEKTTGRSLSERQAILDFIAERTTSDQTSGGHFAITDNFIEITNRP